MRKIYSLCLVAMMALTTWAQKPMQPRVPGKLVAVPEMHMQQGTKAKTANGRQTEVVMAPGAQVSRTAVSRTINDADMSRFAGRKVYGALVNSNDWANMSIMEVPYGIYSFEIGDNPQAVCHISDMTYNFMSGAWGRDRHYGIFVMDMMGAINGTRNITIDTKDWKQVKETVIDNSHGTYSLVASTMAYDPTTDQFYGFRYKEDLTGLDWVRVNLDTDEMEQVAQYRGNTQVYTLAAMPDGQFYYIDAAGDLYTVNKENGRTSLIGNTGANPTGYNQSMIYDGKTGTFLWAAQTTEGSVLLSVNPKTAETERVMRFKKNEQYVSLYITDSEAPADAPAAVGRPQLKYDGDGQLTGNLSFTVPSKTYGGSTLSGDCNLNVWLDGESIKSETAQAGSMSIPLTLEEGNHYIAITLDNEAGFSPLRYIYQYAGYDTPKAVGNVVFEQADGMNKLSWNAAETGSNAGVNRGYVEAATLTYNVVRMPDNVVVATGLTANAFEEATPQDMRNYYYVVTAVNHGHESAKAESNRILCGDSFTVPYRQEFADPVVLADYFTVVDNDGDGNSWRQGYSTEIRLDYIRNGVDADDWLISPAITMEEGKKYRFAMEMKTFTPNYPEDFEILIGTDPEDLSSFKSLKKEEAFTSIASEFGYYTLDFLIDETKDYHMAVRYCTKKNSNGSLMMIHDFCVDLVGNALAPAQATDVSVVADANDELKATVSFTAPTLNLKGEAVAPLTKVTIRRDNSEEVLKTFDAPEAGAQLSWTDEAVPTVGQHTYTITAENAEGVGEPVTVEQFIGVYTAPYADDFEDRHVSELWTSKSINIDNPDNWYGWKWTDNSNTYGRHMNLYYYAMKDGDVDLWLFTPTLKMEKDVVYTIKYDANMNYSLYSNVSYNLYKGTSAEPEAMTTLVTNLPSTDYYMNEQEFILVSDETGKFNLGFGAHGSKAYDYFNASIDNFSLTYRTSAFAPFRMTDYKGVANAQAELKANLSWTAPTINYYEQALDQNEEMIVKVYRGRNAQTLTYTTTATPGAKLQWEDTEALHGFNYYTITCENQYGQGEVIRDTIFVGRDVPALVGSFKVRGSKDNLDAILSWDAPAEGENGGVVLGDEMVYSVYAYEPMMQKLTLIAGDLKETTYTVKGEAGLQHMEYYAVSATMPTEGEGKAIATSVVLGDLYDLPFAESFANSAVSTALWQTVPMAQNATGAGLDNPQSGGYNECDGPQDNDGGCAYIYNGYQYETYSGAILAAPKVRLVAGKDNELRFWAYHFKEKYPQAAYVQVIISVEDTPYEIVSGGMVTVGGNEETGWKEHVIDLSKYSNSDFVSVAFMGITGGYQDCIYLDNVSINCPDLSGISSVIAPESQTTAVYNLQGQRVPANSKGILIVGGRKVIR